MSIRLIVTGGTFDKEYDEIRGNLGFRESHLPEILRISRCRVPVNIEMMPLMDSQDMRD